jgi:hypothetical protein
VKHSEAHKNIEVMKNPGLVFEKRRSNYFDSLITVDEISGSNGTPSETTNERRRAHVLFEGYSRQS